MSFYGVHGEVLFGRTQTDRMTPRSSQDAETSFGLWVVVAPWSGNERQGHWRGRLWGRSGHMSQSRCYVLFTLRCEFLRVPKTNLDINQGPLDRLGVVDIGSS